MTKGQVTYTGINSNSEAYFGSAADATGSINKPTELTISLTTPFVYAPKRGATGAADYCETRLSIEENDAGMALRHSLIILLRIQFTSRFIQAWRHVSLMDQVSNPEILTIQ